MYILKDKTAEQPNHMTLLMSLKSCLHLSNIYFLYFKLNQHNITMQDNVLMAIFLPSENKKEYTKYSDAFNSHIN